MKKKLLLLLLCLCIPYGCTKQEDVKEDTSVIVENTSTVDYSNNDNWAYCQSDESDKQADVFFINPTAYSSNTDHNMPLDNEDDKAAFLGAINMEKGIYDENARFFAPYYQQADLSSYALDNSEEYLSYAYEDVKAAFQYYLDYYNEGRPFIIAGFSQGADMAIRLVKDYMKDESLQKLLISCYAIGWRLTKDEVEEYEWVNPATGKDDVGTIVAFNSEKEGITDSLLIPEGVWTYSINPLNWKTDSTIASKEENLGACFTNYSGEIKTEIPQLTGAYIDENRGSLIVTDIDESEYPPVLSLFESGVYHLYDYQFFYRNLQQNVLDRIDAWYSLN